MRTPKLLIAFLCAFPSLALAETSEDVIKTAQTLLAKTGFEPGAITGVSNPSTEAAIRRFEQQVGCPQTGVATPEVVERLKLFDQVRNLSAPCKFFGFEHHPICPLKEGSAEIDYFSITLNEFVAFGDLDGNATLDAVAMFDAYGGGNSVISYLVAMTNTDGQLTAVASEYFSGPMISIAINTIGSLTVRSIGYRSDDAHCCPTLPSETQFHLRDGQWRRGFSRELGKNDVESLLPSLRSARSEERRSAASALGIIGAVETTEIIPGALVYTPDSPAASAVPELTKSLTVDDELFRADCLDALMRIGPSAKSAVPTIVRYTRSDQPLNIRMIAVEALGAIDASNAIVITELKTLSTDSEESIRSMAKNILN